MNKKSFGLMLMLAGVFLFIIPFATDIGNSEDTFAMALALFFLGIILFILGLILWAVGFFTKKEEPVEKKKENILTETVVEEMGNTMEDSDWYESIEKEVGTLKEKMSKRDYSAYELDALLRVAQHIASLSVKCSQCAESKENITNAINGLVDWLITPKEQKDNYIHTFRAIVNHFEQYHPHNISRYSRKVYVVAIVLTFISSIFLFYFTLALGLSEIIGESTAIPLLILSGTLFVVGIITSVLYYFEFEKKPQTQTRDDSQQEKGER